MEGTALVTGATGLLGSNLVAALRRRGVHVRAVARSLEKARAQLDPPGPDLTLVRGDMTDVGAFAGALRGVDVVFHTAAHFRDSYKGGSHWDELRRVNVDGTAALLEAAYAAGVRRWVHTSSVAVVAAPRPGVLVDETMRRSPDDEADDYYRSKILSDRAVEAFLERHPDFFATLVLPAFMNGPGDAGPTSAGQFVIDFVRRRLPGMVDASFSYVDARDVAEAEVGAADRGRRGERYIVAGRTVPMADVVGLLAEVTSVAGPTRRVPMPLLGVVAAVNEVWARATGRPVLLGWAAYRTLSREARLMTFDSSKAARELGVEFRPLRETFVDALLWFEARGMLGRELPALRSLKVEPGVE
jgi:dihydroflavonol-4-reductase